nr:hypothetical protein [uncultured Pseudodesulfovibrio sp.]
MENTEMKAKDSVAAVALSVARKRSEKIQAMRQALEKEDQRMALDLARELCGLPRDNDA